MGDGDLYAHKQAFGDPRLVADEIGRDNHLAVTRSDGVNRAIQKRKADTHPNGRARSAFLDITHIAANVAHHGPLHSDHLAEHHGECGGLRRGRRGSGLIAGRRREWILGNGLGRRDGEQREDENQYAPHGLIWSRTGGRPVAGRPRRNR